MKILRLTETIETVTEIEIEDEDYETIKDDNDHVNILIEGEDFCEHCSTVIEIEDEEGNIIEPS